MSKGFSVKETIDQPKAVVWDFLTDFNKADKWMTGVDQMKQISDGPIKTGTRLSFVARGKERETRVTALDSGKMIALTSTQGGVTATYTYSLESENNRTLIKLDAVCEATGFWKLLHPVIVIAMKKSDSSHLVKLKNAIVNQDQQKYS